jgi:hypothetical protein
MLRETCCRSRNVYFTIHSAALRACPELAERDKFSIVDPFDTSALLSAGFAQDRFTVDYISMTSVPLWLHLKKQSQFIHIACWVSPAV